VSSYSWSLSCGEVRALRDGAREVGQLYDRNLLSADIGKFVTGVDDCTRFISTQATDRHVLVLIHGFNTTFVDAIRRAASFAQDVHYPGLIIIWSWPSYGEIGAYSLDESRNAWTAPHFRTFITNLLDKVPDLKVDFMAHSMGGRILLQFASSNIRAGSTPSIPSITFAAADIDSEEFKGKLSGNGLPISLGNDGVSTLYASA
jgi:esterase/lipase superfamily enzyme